MTFTIRRYRDGDHAAVRDLFISINRELATPALREAFESYMAVSLRDEIDRLADYYAERQGAFFVVDDGDKLPGVFGIERLGTTSAELRRMYVDAAYRRRGLARVMLAFAEQACRDAGTRVLTLSTSELQQAARLWVSVAARGNRRGAI
jgi:GNAT superfamily N-acetyltransferase